MWSLIGIVAGLLLFVLLAFKGFNLLFSSLAGSLVVLLLSGQNIMDGMTSPYAAGLTEFIRKYLFMFFLSALFGRLLSDTGCAKKIALTLTAMLNKSKHNKKFFCALLVPILYFLLTYLGISGFVVVFTVLPIAKDLFLETDTPWRLYCCAGAQTINSAFLAGSLQAGNIYAMDVCHTQTTAGFIMSLIAVVVFWIVSLVMIKVAVNHAERAGEGFLETGTGIKQAEMDDGLSTEQLPHLIVSLIPLLTVLVMSAVFRTDVVIALTAGCLLTILAGFKNIRSQLKASISAGITAAYGPIICVSATYAIGVVVKAMEGFSYFESVLGKLPRLLSGTCLGLVASFVMASVAAPIPTFGTQMLEHYVQAGLTNELAHRMMLITSFPSIAPHNAGISNAATVLKLPYAQCVKTYMLFTYIPGFCSLLACFAYINLTNYWL